MSTTTPGGGENTRYRGSCNLERITDSATQTLFKCGFHVKRTWLHKCVELLISSGYTANVDALIPQIYAQMLFTPIRQWGEAFLPKPTGQPGSLSSSKSDKCSQKINGPHIVEVRDFQNIGSSQTQSSESHEKDGANNTLNPGGSLRRILKILVSDGHNHVVAIEYTPTQGLNPVSFGSKLLLRHISIQDNVLLLTPTSAVLLGGTLESCSVSHNASSSITQNLSVAATTTSLRTVSTSTIQVSESLARAGMSHSGSAGTETYGPSRIRNTENGGVASSTSGHSSSTNDRVFSSPGHTIRASEVDVDISMDTSQSSGSNGVLFSPPGSQSSGEERLLKDLSPIKLQKWSTDRPHVSLLEGVSLLREQCASQVMVRCTATGIVNHLSFTDSQYNFALLVSETDMSHTEAVSVDSTWLRSMIGVDAASAEMILRPKEKVRKTPNRKILKSRFSDLGKVFRDFDGIITCQLQEEKTIQFVGSDRKVVVDIVATDFRELPNT